MYKGLIMRIALSLMVLLLLVAVWLFDVVAAMRGDSINTVSAALRDWSIRFPVLPFAAGVLTGHVLWP
jgi:hypothetical protein